MRQRTTQLGVILVFTLIAVSVRASNNRDFGVEVLTDNGELSQLDHRGSVYVEAERGQSYELRISNPTPYRVAVALSVDGLNTIDAKHSDAWGASKWVLEPYGSAVISGWQINENAARRFFFTGEKNSYGAALGQTDNLGVIEAVYFRERQPIITYEPWYGQEKAGREQSRKDSAPPAPPSGKSAGSPAPQSAGALSDEYAATGMGDRTDHEIERVSIDLERKPLASVRIRYEYHNQLVKLGVLPSYRAPLDRRENARGFESYCPQPAEHRRVE